MGLHGAAKSALGALAGARLEALQDDVEAGRALAVTTDIPQE